MAESLFDFERYGPSDLRRRIGAKWSDPDRLAAWVADMDFPLAPAIHDALSQAVSLGDVGYPTEAMEVAVAEVFSQRVHRRHGLNVDPTNVVVVTDVVQAIAIALMTFSEPGDKVAFFTPSYPPFFSVVTETRRVVLPSDLAFVGGRYRIDFDALSLCVERERPRCLLLCNPHNPTGRAFSRAELEQLSELVVAHDMFVISDEIHADLVLDGSTYVPIATISPEMARRTVTLCSASKAFNIAGLRCAVAAFGSKELADRFRGYPAVLRGAMGTLAMAASLAAWSACDPWLDELVGYLAVNRAVTADVFASREDVTYTPGEATYLAWLDLREAGLGDDPAGVFFDKAGVTLSSGPAFGEAGKGFCRLNFATPRPVLEEILARLAAVLDERHAP